jgi:hypothetical protein
MGRHRFRMALVVAIRQVVASFADTGVSNFSHKT